MTISDIAGLLALIQPGEQITATREGWRVVKTLTVVCSAEAIDRALQDFDLLIKRGSLRVVASRDGDRVVLSIEQIALSPWI